MDEIIPLWGVDGCVAAEAYLDECYETIDGHYLTLRDVIHASQQFEIRKQSQADTGPTVVWYRSRPRETSKEQE